MDFYTWRERRKQGLPGFESPSKRPSGTSTSVSASVNRKEDEDEDRYTRPTTSRNDSGTTSAQTGAASSSSSRLDPQEWAKSSAAIINEIGEYYGGYKQSDEAVDRDIADRALDLLSKASSVRNQFARNSESRKSIDEMVSSLSQAYDWATRKMSEYKQYSSEAQYKYKDNTDFYDKYGKYLEAEDFEEKSQYVSTKYGEPKYNAISNMYTDTGFGDITYDYVNRNKDARSISELNSITNNSAFLGTNKSYLDNMTDDEIGIYNYIYASYGKDRAESFLSDLTGELNARQRGEREQSMKEYADDSPVLSSAYSILTSPLKGLSYLGQIADYAANGEIDQNAGYNKFSYENNAIRNEVSSNIENSGSLGGVGSFLYNTGMSMGDFLMTTAVSGGNSAMSLAIMGSGAAADTVIASKDMGLSDRQSFLLGTIAGAAEIVTEKFSIDALFKSDWDKGALRYIIKNTLTEGAEEAGSDVINIAAEVADFFLSKDKSLWQLTYDQYISEGMTEKEAIRKMITDNIKEIGLDFLGGALSGGVMGSAGAAINQISNNIQYRNIYSNDDAKVLVNKALEIDPNNVYAQNLKSTLDSGKSISGNQIAKLIQQNEEAIVKNDRTAVENAAKERLSSLGERANIDVIARAVTKTVYGETLNTQEKNALKSSRYGLRVQNELNPENIRSGNYTTSWAENLNTNRINVDEYSAALNRAAEYSDIPSTVDMNINDAAVLYPRVDRSAADTVNAKAAENRTVNPENSTGSATSLTETKPAEPETKASSEQVISKQDTSELQVSSKSDTSLPKTPANEQDINVPDENRTARTLTDAAEQEYNTSPESTAEVEPEQSSQSLESLSKKYGKQAGAMVHTYVDGQDIVKYDRAYQAAYDMGKSGVSRGYAMQSDSASYLNESQRQLAYEAGQAAAGSIAVERQSSIERRANGKTGWKRGTVRGEGVSLDELKSKFNDTQNQAYKILSAISEATGIDIALYKSESDESGNFTGAQGYYKRSDAGTIYLDINAGLSNVKDVGDLSKYTVLRTFSHEFTHYIENWSPVRYNELRAAVFSHMTESGEDVGELIERQQALMSEDGRDVSYDRASREVVAEAMVDILPDSKFIDSLAENHKSVFDKLLEKLRDFISNLKSYFGRLYQSSSPEARAMKRQLGETLRYAESIVEKFDAAAVSAVESYQRTVATDEVAETTAETAAETTAETEVNESAPAAEAAEGETFRDKYMRAPRDQRDEVIDALGHKDKRKSSQFPTSIMADETLSENNAMRNEQQNTAAEINENTEVTANGTETTEAVKTENGGTADTGAVSEPAGMGEGTPRLPAGLQEENLQGMDELGGAVPVSDERGTETRGDGSRTDSGRSGGRPDEGDSQSGDLRGSDRVEATTPPETTGQSQETAGQSQVESQANADETQSNTDSTGTELTDKVAETIEQRSQEKPKGTNFVIGDSLDLPNGEKSRFRANVDAIRTLYNIMSENRFASPEEQVILSKYVGWGGLDKAFSGYHWKAEYDELRSLVKEGIISEDDYNAARRSTMNAHYTDISVIKAMYDGLSRLGFMGGRMLEPSAGVGNFIGAMPDEMTAKVRSWTAVELDNITGNILKHLYPNSDVRIEGFEKANIPDGYMDVAIGNVPFGNYAVIDKSYPKQVTGAIHNYFFAKSLDKVRPGGIVMFITSNYTMNSKDQSVRRYIMNKADLLGAIALPEGAFKENAGTEVATTIMILKRRADGTPYAGADFLESEGITLENDKYSYMGNVYQNRYFAEHPEMVLGTPARNEMYQSRDSITYKPLTDRGSLANQIREAFSHIDGRMDYPAKPTKERVNFQVEKNVKKPRDGSLVSRDGKIYEEQNGELVEKTMSKSAAARTNGLIGIRDAMRNLLLYQQQGLKKTEIDKARKLLNKLYDEFVSKYGYLNTTANRSALYDDPDRYALLALEVYNRKQKSATKSDIFTKNTVSPNRAVTSAKNIGEAVAVSMNESGGVDTGLIARLTARDEESVKRELIDSRIAFKKKDGSLEIAETYLSGNVRAKLREAEALAAFDKDYNNNIEALREVVPKDIAHTDIYVNPGATWIPTSVYSDFARELLGISTWQRDTVSITYNDIEGYKVILNNKRAKEGARNRQVWGTPKRTFVNILEALLNSRSLSVGYKGEDGKYHVDKDATTAANAKAEEVANEFRKWLWNDETRKNELSRLYNDVFNSIVTPKYNGDNLTVNGTNPEKPLRPHQRDAVERIIMSGGNTLLAHKVGAGKTYEMAAAAMKLRELGIAKKPMFIVPKALVAQWGKEFNSFFPASKLLVAEDNDFSPSNRRIFTNRIRNGDWDAVIVSYEQFEKVPMSAEFQKQFYTEQVNEIIATIEAEKAESGKFASVKDLEKRRVNLENKIKKLSDVSRDENNIIFEDLGVDSLFVDEAHNFKNLFYTTRMNNIAGLGNKNGSARAFDLYTKVRYLQGLNGGRGIVFATATPVMNSMSEMYIMQQYLQPDMLKSLGLNNFDAWAKQFGEVVNGVEIKPSGQGYRIKQSFSRFKNLSELQMLFRNFADVLTNIPGLKVPKMKGGGVITIVSEPSKFQQDYMKALEERADNVKNVDPHEDNMLKITSDGRKVSYTQRMIDPSLPYEEGCKIYKCADNVAQIYKETAGIKGTQIIFCDMATPKSGSGKTDAEVADELIDTDSAQLYDDIRARLVSEGVKAEEIAFIHDANTDAKRRELFDAMNDGTVRVLIGSTGKMGVGMNAQKRIVAIHHLDAPWRPGDVEQRDGRAFRQGNMNDEVSKFVYVTKGSFDTRLWDILERKQNFINQIMNGDNVGREVEDTGEVTLSAAEVKALASGSPLILEQVQLETDIKKLESLQRSHNQAATGALTKYAQDAARIAEYRERVKEASADMSTMRDTWSEGKFEVNIGGRVYKDKKDAGLALIAEAQAKAMTEGYTKIGEFAGLDIKVVKTSEGIDGILSGVGSYPFKTYPGNPTHGINVLASTASGLQEKLDGWKSGIETATADMKLQKELAEKPFDGQAELDKKRARYNEVMDILNPREEQSLDTLDEDTDTQEQQRYNLPEHSETDYTEEDNEWIQYQNRVTDEKLLTFLNNQQHEKVYRAMQVIDGKLYPPMAAKVVNEAGVNQLVEPSEIGVWEQAVERPDLIRNGNKFKLDKANGSSIEAAYNPYFHTSRSPLNDQFSSAYKRDNLVIVEGEIPSSELTSGYKAQYAKDSVGEMKWHSGPVSSKLKGDKARRVILSRWFRPLRIIPDAEIAKVIAKMLEGENISIPYKVITPSLRTALESEGVDIQYQRRESTLSDREVLERAADRIDTSRLSESERAALDKFSQKIKELNRLAGERKEAAKQYESLRKINENSEEAKAAKHKVGQIEYRMSKLNGTILDVEDKRVLRRVLHEARGLVESEVRAEERDRTKTLISNYRNRRDESDAVKKYRSRLMTDIGDLMDSLIKPDVKSVSGHIPEMLKNPIIDFIKSIDFSSKRQLKGGDATKADLAFTNKLSKLRGAIVEAKSLYGAYSGTLDLPEDFMPKLQALGDAVTALTGTASEKGYVINRMSSADLKSLSEIIRTLKKSISRFNTFHQNSFFKHVSDAAESSIKYLDDLPLDETANKATNFMFWQTMRPAYAFERFGEGGKSIYDELRRGQARLAFHVKEIENFTKQTYTDNEVKGWERDVKSIELSDGSTMNLTVAQIMGLYKMYAQEDSRRHMFVGGIRAPKFAIRAKGKFRKDTHVDKGHMVSEADIEKIIGTLTPRQKEVADKLQRYMATQGAEWGNYVSMARFGERLFTNEQYYPINVDQRQLLNSDGTEKPPEGASLYALLNMNFTKQRVENASNGLMVYSIFDVFANHMSDMAQYNAMALPVLDALKWLNYRQFDTDNSGHILYYNDDGRTAYIGDDGRYHWSDSNELVSGKERAGLKRKLIGTVRTSLTKAYGTEVVEKSTDEGTGYAVRFITNILKAYNNTESLSNPYDQIGMKSLARFNRSAIAYNLRVALQQPIAYLRAAMQLGADNMARGILHPIRNKEEMLKYSGIAVWKDLGFYDINISRGLNTLIKHDEGKLAQVNDFGMGLAELMDRTTWAAIWGASRDYVTRTTGLNEGDRGFIEKVIRRFEDTIYKTQVVDSVLTRSEIMRNKGFFVRAATSFMSEPMTEIAMISDAAFNFTLDVRRSNIGTAVKKNAPHIARVVAVYALTNVVNSLVTALLDAERDDDDYQEWYEKIGEAFKDNLKDSLNPFSKMPFMTEFSELIKSTMNMFGADTYGNEPPQLYMQWSDSYLDAVKTFADKIMGRETNYQWYQSIYKMLQAVSGITGIAAAPLVREVVSFWNATIGWKFPDMKVRTYYPGDAANIKYAYLDGFLTAKEAIDELIRTGVSEDEDEAYFKVKEWDSGEASWSRYSEVYGAVLDGKGYSEAVRELTGHGYSEREVTSQVQSQIGKWYRDGDITKAKATQLMKQYSGKDDDEVEKIVTEWSCKVVTGINYDDIKYEYLDGNITKARAIEMRAKYGSMTEEEAEDYVRLWDFQKEHPEAEDISIQAVDKYTEYCEPRGISVIEFYDVWKFKSEAASDVNRRGETIPNSKRDKVADYINSLPLTRRQKDALWLAIDYSENTLDEAPWR